MAKNFWLAMLAILLTAIGGASAQKAQFVYASTDAGIIYQYQVTDSGVLQPLMPPSLQAATEAIKLVLHPSGRFVYAVTVHELNSGHALAQVVSYRINPNGTLTPLAAGSRTLAAPADNVTMDPKGRFLFVSGENDRLFTFRIQHDGTLRPLADNKDVPTFRIDTQGDGGGELTGTYNYEILALDPTGRFMYLYSIQYGFDSQRYDFLSYRLDQQGRLHPIGQMTHGQGDIGPCFTAPRNILFVSRDYGSDEGTLEYHIGLHGRLTPASQPILPHQFAIMTTESRDGEILWTSSPVPKDIGKSSLASYRVGRGARLTRKAAHMGVLPWSTRLRASVSGRFLYATDYEQGNYTHKPHSSLFGFAITPQATLKPLAAPPQRIDGSCVSFVVGIPLVGVGKSR